MQSVTFWISRAQLTALSFSGVKADCADHSFHSFEQKTSVRTNTEHLFPGEKKCFFLMETVAGVIKPQSLRGGWGVWFRAGYAQRCFWGHVRRNEVWNCIRNLLLEGFEIRVFPAAYMAVSFPEVYSSIVSAAGEVRVVPCQEMHLNKSQNILSRKGPTSISSEWPIWGCSGWEGRWCRWNLLMYPVTKSNLLIVRKMILCVDEEIWRNTWTGMNLIFAQRRKLEG